MLETMSQNGIIQPLLTDFYQISMAYAYWDNKKMNDHAVFDLFFRKNPFKGEFTIFAGLKECITYVKNFAFSEDDIDYLKQVMPSTTDPEFFHFLKNLTTKDVTISAIPEGTVVFAKVPLIRVEGPLAVVQLLETTLLNLVNFASLVATNAARFRHAAGDDKLLLEFGLRRAQGPDGGLSASKYCYLGGFDGTSDVLAAKKFKIPVKGTHAHAFVSSFNKNDEVNKFRKLLNKNKGKPEPLLPVVEVHLKKICDFLGISKDQVNKGELIAFTAYASSFPSYFLALIDTYDTLKSGCINFLAVTLALNDFGYKSIGIRIDSGDLAYLSQEVRKMFIKVGNSFNEDWISTLSITASNDINEDTLYSLAQQGHSINAFGIGTHLVTCQKQPALGCVFKLVELNGDPRMKLSQDIAKVSIPGKKNVYRLYGHDGSALLDLLTKECEEAPKPDERVLCQHPIQGAKRAYVKPSTVENLLKTFWKDGEIKTPLQDLEGCRQTVKTSLSKIRQDHKRALNPTPYKVSVTSDLYKFMHNLWVDCAPICELN